MSKKRIVFCTFGSLGDIYPLLALARELRLRGHFPVMATTPAYRGLIESTNVGFHPLRPDIDVNDPKILRHVTNESGAVTACDLLEELTGQTDNLTPASTCRILAR